MSGRFDDSIIVALRGRVSCGGHRRLVESTSSNTSATARHFLSTEWHGSPMRAMGIHRESRRLSLYTTLHYTLESQQTP